MSNLGQDLSCIDDLLPSGLVVSGGRLIAEAAIRRLTTPRGALLEDPDYGLDIHDWINDGMTPLEFAARRADVEAELLKDARIAGADVSLQLVQGVAILAIALDTVVGNVSLVASVSAINVQLLSVQ